MGEAVGYSVNSSQKGGYTIEPSMPILILIGIANTYTTQDFSEDTYRTLAAADNAVMLVDAAKGLEPQTRKLFEVRSETKHRSAVVMCCFLGGRCNAWREGMGHTLLQVTTCLR